MQQDQINFGEPPPKESEYIPVIDSIKMDIEKGVPHNHYGDYLYRESMGLLLTMKSIVLQNENLQDVIKAVVEDLSSRSEFGTKKYGTPLKPFNGRNPLKDSYEELLDLVFYTRQLKYEMDYANIPTES